MTITTLQLHKRSSYKFENIQDKCAVDAQKMAFALADGTTQSYCSEIWADILTQNFVANPETDVELLIQNFKEAAQVYKSTKFTLSSNPAKASLEREKQKHGGTATFIGLVFLPNSAQINVTCCGDTNLFHWKKTPFPFADKDALDANKSFLNTEKLLNDKIDSSFFQETTLTYTQNDVIILATDALSRLFLKNPNIIDDFIQLKDFEQLHEFCLKYWDARQLEEDDISAIIININNQNKLTTIVPPADFSFPKEEEYVFIPTSLDPPIIDENGDILNQKKINVQNMQEIKRELSLINKKIEDIRQVQALHQILMFVTIGLLLATMLILYMRSGSDNKPDNKLKNPPNSVGTANPDKGTTTVQFPSMHQPKPDTPPKK